MISTMECALFDAAVNELALLDDGTVEVTLLGDATIPWALSDDDTIYSINSSTGNHAILMDRCDELPRPVFHTIRP